ncbi:hypothetical protein PO909_026533, partial [Leuciscus waleckii]
VCLHHQLALSSSESSESNESSSSEEITVQRTTIARTTVAPIVLNTMRPDILEDNRHQTSDHTAQPGLALTTPNPANTEQKVVELGLDTSLSPPQPGPAVPDLVSPDVTTQELRCYVVDLTSPAPKPARGDNV